jgi:predicted DNA-binding transcriptional regulator AlpA
VQPSELLTEEETARAIGVEVKTLRRLIESGEFPDGFFPSPNKKRWLRADAESYLHLRSRLGAPTTRKRKKSEKNLPGQEGALP